MPLPGDGVLGPVGGGNVRHCFYGQDWDAEMGFKDAKAVERHANTSLVHSAMSPHITPIKLAGEELRWYHSDVSASNFFIDTSSPDDQLQIWMVNFNLVGVLPSSFASYSMHNYRDMFGRDVLALVRERTSCAISPNLRMMSVASGLLVMVGDPSLGLNEEGQDREGPNTKRIKRARKKFLEKKPEFRVYLPDVLD
ncbi:hypothetical protein CONPUDRAFT_144991 [Coniophora puteana RWD-64-598 SS2]|uniref:Aminoglycoside phosphotransferase domain-containing protein n=1 Tax=Coniophora puteana (strain RWD-64-598) TaxID=741705 RepID=A0A5M3MLA1_CONPW|nr:uncharacterized protein CONPUDRAFT_144991 [Coniophora puteana RWD-64-598 SS2]EIW79873.1 hypothetical protein CONPUDRAFT_144991 [Coniophora puteana RWD-64-598 SS2]